MSKPTEAQINEPQFVAIRARAFSSSFSAPLSFPSFFRSSRKLSQPTGHIRVKHIIDRSFLLVMDEDIAMKFWREWDESVDKKKHIKVIVDSVMCAADHIKEAKSKERKKAMLSFLAMSLNGYFTDLYCFAHTKGFEEAQSQGRKGLDDNRFI